MFILLLAGGGSGWLETWLNYPGLEGWKFINLAIFASVAYLILRHPVRDGLAARRERIRLQLIEAEKERDEAQARLTEAENRVASIDADIDRIRKQAQEEAQLERQRLADATDQEIEKMRRQATREIETAAKVARQELQRFLAYRSVDLAREAVRKQIRPEDDSRLIKEGIRQLGRRSV